jgi:general secretion pathway protein A
MYLEYFGLSAQPFKLTPDSDFLFMSEAHSRAKAYMDYTVWNREGFVVITGEIGCGKTTLIQKLLSELDENVVVAKVFQTQLDEVEFLQAVLVEFGLNPFNAKKVELLDMLNNFLIEQFLQGKQIVLIVDDAHNLSVKVLEEIRMFAGLETRKEKILHVILVGQPQLTEVLDYPELQQLMQRVKLRYHIRALNEREVGDYIRHRLSVVVAANRGLFPPDTLPIIFKYAGGIPRLINTLCDTTLTCAYADNLPAITAEVVEDAAKELQWSPYAERVDNKRTTVTRAPDQGVIREILQEQSQKLGLIAARVGKIEELSPALVSIGRSLAAIEAHLRNLAQSRGVQPRPDSTASPRQKSG